MRRAPMTIVAVLTAAAAAVCGCADNPVGNDVAADIKAYAYQNKPRPLASLMPAGDPYHGERMALPFTTGSRGGAIASSDFPWRIPAACRGDYRAWLSNRSERVADQLAYLKSGRCMAPAKTIFVGAAITGGGNKSAVFSTEVLFELARYGITQDLDMVSSVSGGSFTALLYALSCDPGDACAPLPGGAKRPVWSYGEATRRMERNYFWAFVGKRYNPTHLYLNSTTQHGSDDDLADTVADRLLYQTAGDFTFADLNPKRPNLVLNASNVTRTRANLDIDSDIPYDAKRPLSDDDALHFSFTQQYFWRLLLDLDKFPLKYALVASAAFPLIVDRPSLRHFKLKDLEAIQRGTPPYPQPDYLSLWDGGVHDNFGVSEILSFVQCAWGYNVRRVNWPKEIYRRECGTDGRMKDPPKAALAIGINSSLLRSAGQDGKSPKHRTWDSYVLPVRVVGAVESVDMIMAASGELRKMQLRSVLEALDDRWHGVRRDRNNPYVAAGPYQYVDIDIESLLYASCLGPPGTLDPRPINSANGATDVTRCQQLQGVLKWNRERGVDLPTVAAGFCSSDACPEIAPLGAKAPPFFIEQVGRDQTRTLDNRWLFDAVREVPTDFQLDPNYAWLLRYAARWSVAIRLWNLCTHNRELVDRLTAGAPAVCESVLPPRKLSPDAPARYDDNVGSPAWYKTFGGSPASTR